MGPPRTTRKLKPRAFSDMARLRAVSMNAALTKIGDSAFAGSGLRSVTIPRGVKALGCQVFKRCRRLQKVAFSGGCRLEKMDQKCFRETGIAKIALLSAVTDVQACAFYRCEDLCSAELNEGLETLGASAGGCGVDFVQQVQQSTDVISLLPRQTMLGKQLLWALRQLREVRVPGGVERVRAAWFAESGVEVGAWAFAQCGRLRGVKFEGRSSLEKIGAFRGRARLQRAVLPLALREIGKAAFYGSRLSEIVFRAKQPIPV